MWSGTSALKNIDQSLQTIRNDVVRLDTQLSQLTESLAANQRRRLSIIRDIAMVRLVEIESGGLAQSLSAADREADKILVERDRALLELNQQIDSQNQHIEESEREREELLVKVNQMSQQIVDQEAEVQTALAKDAAYLAQLEKARNSESVALEANQKVENAQLDMAEKAKPYQQDNLFMYLWGNGFGTTEYSGGFFARFMDGWVARLIDFEPARINFWNLTEIPKRLAEHADAVDNLSDEEHMAVQQLELNALDTAGVKQLEQDVAALRITLDAHDDALEELEGELNKQLDSRAKFVAGEDEYIQKCVNSLTGALDHQNLKAVHRYVLATNSPTDDQLVIELQGVDDQLKTVAADLRDVRNMHDQKLNKLKELEQVRRNFKNSRFDDVRSGFGNESLLAGVLGQFLQGVVSGSDLWRVIQRNQRYRNVGSIPDFGSGGLGQLGDILGGGRRTTRTSRGGSRRKQRNSTWHWPSPRGGGGGFNFPSGGGSRGGGGGFKTGGGF